jgi:hypothetical protein
MNESPFYNLEPQHPAPEIMNYSDGLQAVRRRVTNLLEFQHMVVVAINGAGPAVGKTTLTGELARGFLEQNVPVGVCLDGNNLDVALGQQRRSRVQFGCADRGIIVMQGIEPPHGRRIFGNADIRQIYDNLFKKKAQEFGVPLDKIDLWVALYSDSTPFDKVCSWWDQPYNPFEDVIIRNEHARTK